MKNQSGGNYTQWLFLALPVMWIGAGLASGYEDGMALSEVLAQFSEWADHPFLLRWTPYTLRTCINKRLSRVWKWEITTIDSAEETEIS